jgi:ABC-type branched-subunit amino acid transport system ATPase component
MNDILVKVQNMSKSFGGLKAIDNCTIEIKEIPSQELLDLTVQEKVPFLI